MLKLKDVRGKHQERAREIVKMEDEKQKEKEFESFAISMVEAWDFLGEDGEVLPLVATPETFQELKIGDRDLLTDTLTKELFPDKPVPKASAANSSSSLTASKVKRAGNGKSRPGLTTS